MTVHAPRRLILWSCAAVAVWLGGCHWNQWPGRPDPADRPVPANQVLEFGALFQQNCSGCHGADGKLGPAPPLNDALFLAIVPDEVMLTVITEGRKGTSMPAFAEGKGGPLTDAQVAVLAKGIKPRWKGAKAPDRVPPYLAPQGQPAGDRERGAKLFARACGSCHGEQGQGGQGKDSHIGAVNESAFLALISDQALRRIVITGRPDLGMPNYAEKTMRPPDFQPLTSPDVAELVALLAYWRQRGSAGGK